MTTTLKRMIWNRFRAHCVGKDSTPHHIVRLDTLALRSDLESVCLRGQMRWLKKEAWKKNGSERTRIMEKLLLLKSPLCVLVVSMSIARETLHPVEWLWMKDKRMMPILMTYCGTCLLVDAMEKMLQHICFLMTATKTLLVFLSNARFWEQKCVSLNPYKRYVQSFEMYLSLSSPNLPILVSITLSYRMEQVLTLQLLRITPQQIRKHLLEAHMLRSSIYSSTALMDHLECI
mmetsp:Transcript_5348/g.9380  ORF Transcript_5348/g.9380 Transcript_5348/m.9380 type:complete len:232 (+) Transcript_5348:333-1028(+)